MADRFPAIAEYNRELSGGAIFIKQAATQSFIGRMAASVAAFIAQYPVRTGFALAAASVIGYFALSSSPKTEVAVISHEPQVQVAQNQSGINGSNKTNMSDKSYTSHGTYSTYENLPKTTLASHSNRAANNPSQLKNNSLASNNENLNSNKQSIAPPEKNITPDKGIADNKNNATPANDGKQVNDNPVKDNPIKDVAKKDDAPKAIAENKPTANENDANVGSHVINPLRNRDEHPAATGLAIRAFEGFGSALVNAHANDATLASKTEFTPSVGVDYSWNPNFSVGVEAGSAAISQLLTQSSVQQGAIDLPISRVVTSNSIAASSQIYGRVMLRYTVNPYDDWRFETSFGGGAAFASKAAPLISGAVLIGHDVAGALAIYGGVALSGTWTSANALAGVASVSALGDPIGYVTMNHALSTLFTPSASLRIGLKYKL